MLQSFIEQYGYLAIVVGTFFEGETILILAGLAVHLGYLELPWVVVSAFIGALSGDQLYFYLGHRHGQAWLKRRPRWERHSHKVLSLLQRHQTWLILGFRFIYGLRTVTPFVIGMSSVSPRRFLMLNVIGALIWVTIVTLSGYLFGHLFELVVGKLKHYELMIFSVVALVGVAVWLARRIR